MVEQTQRRWRRLLKKAIRSFKEGGGFEILRRGPSPSELTLIPPPPSGYTVKFLRDSTGLLQAMAFVRPLQCNLNREAIKPVSDHSQVGNQRIIWYLLRIFFKGYRGLAREMKILFYFAKWSLPLVPLSPLKEIYMCNIFYYSFKIFPRFWFVKHA